MGRYCFYGNSDNIDEAVRRFQAHVNKTTQIPADLRGIIFSVAMRNGDTTTFDQLVKVSDVTSIIISVTIVTVAIVT